MKIKKKAITGVRSIYLTEASIVFRAIPINAYDISCKQAGVPINLLCGLIRRFDRAAFLATGAIGKKSGIPEDAAHRMPTIKLIG